MQPLPKLSDVGAIGHKYLGGGFGGYALFIFDTKEKRDAQGRCRWQEPRALPQARLAPVQVPGEREMQSFRRAQTQGISISKELWTALAETSL